VRSRYLFLTVVLTVAPLAWVGCGDDDKGGGGGAQCGAGTTEVDGVCVPDAVTPVSCAAGTVRVGNTCVPAENLCDAGQAWVGGACVDLVDCAAGTVRGPSGDCVPADNLCDPGFAWSDGECVAEGCGAGFANLGGECVPVAELCDEGEVFVAGECRADRACGPGTVEIDGACVPPPGPTPDVTEGLGDTTPFTLPGIDETIVLGGNVAPPVQGRPDFDTFTFQGTAGQRLRIESTALGAPLTSFFVEHGEYFRLAVPVGSRNAARQVVLPYTGEYELTVGYFLYNANTGGFVVPPDGADDFDYLVAVTPLANPTPTPQSTGNFEVTGDITALTQFLVSGPAVDGSVIRLRMFGHNVDVPSLYWTSTPAYGSVSVEFASGLHAVPAGGLLVTTDYFFAGALDTGYTLTSERVDTTLLNPGVTLPSETIDAGGLNFYRFTLAESAVVRAAFTRASSAGDTILAVADEQLNVLAVAGGAGLAQSVHVALDPGTYFLVVSDRSFPDEPGSPFGYSVRYDVMPLVGLTPPVDEGAMHARLEPYDAFAVRDEAFVYFDVGGVGEVTLTLDPGAHLDVSFDVFTSRILAVGDVYFVADTVDGAGTGGDESAMWLLPPDRVYVRLVAEAVTGVDADVAVDVTFFKTMDTYIREVEPNNFLDQATALGALPDGDTYYGYGHFRDLDPGTGWTDDFYLFTLTDNARVVVDMTIPWDLHPLIQSVYLLVVDGNLSFVADNTVNIGGDIFVTTARLEFGAPPGAYYIYTFELADRPVGWYKLATTADFYDVCLPGRPTCTGASGNELGTCNATGDGSVGPTTLCFDGCDSSRNACEVGPVETEPNDTPASATSLGDLPPGDGIRVVEGTIENRGPAELDFDWYRFTLAPREGPYELTLRTLPVGPANLDTQLWLYDASLTELGYDDDSGVAGIYSKLGPEFVGAGTYYVRVGYWPGTSSVPSSYYLELDVAERLCFPNTGGACDGSILRGTCSPDGTGREDAYCSSGCSAAVNACMILTEPGTNNTLGTAFDLGGLGSLAGVASTYLAVDGTLTSSSDQDWFVFSVSEPVVVTLETKIRGDSGLDSVVDLADLSLGAFVAVSDDIDYPNNVLSRVIWPLHAGDYAILVRAYAGAPYRLEVTARPLVAASLGSFARGAAILPTTGGPLLAGASAFYTITFTQSVTLSGTLTATSGDPDFYVYSTTHVLLDWSADTGDETFGDMSLAAGTYLLQVHAYDIYGDEPVEQFTLNLVTN
jgi:hypothetical protein